jgi:hypothetical protein
MKKLIFFILFACLPIQAMYQTPEPIDSAIFAFYMHLCPFQIKHINKSQTPRVTIYQATFYNGDMLTCLQERNQKQSAFFKKHGSDPSSQAITPINSCWYAVLESTYQFRQDMNALAKKNLQEHQDQLMREKKLPPVKADPHREKRIEYHQDCILAWHHRLEIIKNLETPSSLS